MTVATLPVDVMVGMLRKGETGAEIMTILDTIVPEQVNDDLGATDTEEVAA